MKVRAAQRRGVVMKNSGWAQMMGMTKLETGRIVD
jgi:hypothetical protein